MNTNKTEFFNIFLILLSLIISFVFPFELFLFSYAILGPLHYCTEISWLHEKNYFTDNKKNVIPLYFFSFLFLFSVNSSFLSIDSIVSIIVFSISISFLFSFFIIRQKQFSLLYFFIILILCLSIQVIFVLKIIFYYFVATLIHVYFFTGIFILSGNLKRRNMIGHIGFLFFIMAPFVCFLLPVQVHHTYDYFKNNYSLIMHNMIKDNFSLLNISVSNENFFQNEWVIKFSRFISFAYTYHYLNWFSKTNIIGWYHVSKKRNLLIFCVWIISVLSYGYNYMFGYQLLLFLSMLHVFLEFPLNWLSILNMFKTN